MKIEIHTVVNGRELQPAVKPNQTLLEFLRDELHLKGSMEGCGVGFVDLAPYWLMGDL